MTYSKAPFALTAWTCARWTCRSCGGAAAWCCRTRSSSPAPSRRTYAWARPAWTRRWWSARREEVNIADFIHSLPEGFQSEVKERGSTLSTGQKQLISFARALAHNPRILILDEATSSVDTETEFRVREALTRLVEGRTSLIIAHRLSTIQRADKIIVMHKGKVREMRHAPATAGAARHLLQALPIAVQGPGARRGCSTGCGCGSGTSDGGGLMEALTALHGFLKQSLHGSATIVHVAVCS